MYKASGRVVSVCTEQDPDLDTSADPGEGRQTPSLSSVNSLFSSPVSVLEIENTIPPPPSTLGSSSIGAITQAESYSGQQTNKEKTINIH